MKLRGNSYFNKDDIYNLENDYKVTHPSWYLTKLNTLVVSLLEKLTETGLLEKKIEKSDDLEEIPYYKWTQQATIKTESIIDEEDELRSRFLKNFIEFEKYIREFYYDIFDDKNSKHSVTLMIKRFIEIEMLPKRWGTDQRLDSLVHLRNKIVHGDVITPQDLDVVQNYSFEINILKGQLVEEYTYFITSKYLLNFNYFTTRELPFNNTFDFLAKNESKNIGDILFEVKLLSSTNTAMRQELIYKTFKELEDYNELSGRNENYLVFIIYANNGRKMFDTFREQLERTLLKEFPQLKNFVLTFYNSEYRGDANQSRLKIVLNKLMEKINTKETR